MAGTGMGLSQQMRQKQVLAPQMRQSLEVLQLQVQDLCQLAQQELEQNPTLEEGSVLQDSIDAAREQWNDGTNTLAVAPGEVIAFSRNYVTNGILRDNGVTVHEIPSAELSRGRGGPRCMSMPLWRE